MRLLVFLALLVATAPADGRYGFVSQYLGITDDLYRLLRYSICIVSVGAYLVQSRTSAILLLRKYWPLWVIAAANFATIMFARDADWSLRQSTVALVTIMMAVVSIEAFQGHIGVLIRLAAFTFIGCVLLVMLAPSVSTISPFLQAAGSVGDAGSWLGVFASKNELGHASGILFAVVVLYGRRLLSPVTFMTVTVATLLCLVLSKSASGIVLATAGFGLHLLLKIYHSRKSVVLKALTFVLLVVGALFYQELLDWGLASLGKDETLTGRTDIWTWGWLLIINNFPAGLGYGQTWTPAFTGEVSDLFSVVHLHNGFVELLANNGALGLLDIILFIYILTIGARVPAKASAVGVHATPWVVVLLCWLASAMTEPYVLRPLGFLAIIGYLALAGILNVRATATASEQARTPWQPRVAVRP